MEYRQLTEQLEFDFGYTLSYPPVSNYWDCYKLPNLTEFVQ